MFGLEKTLEHSMPCSKDTLCNLRIVVVVRLSEYIISTISTAVLRRLMRSGCDLQSTRTVYKMIAVFR